MIYYSFLPFYLVPIQTRNAAQKTVERKAREEEGEKLISKNH